MGRPCASACCATVMSRSQGGADVAVVNTCCVTHEAISKSRQAVSRAARSHGRVYVTGCGANLRGAFAGTAPNVTVVALPSEEMPIAVSAGVGALGCVQADARLERTRAFVKIQDGCSFSCSFCVIPLVRGATRSRRADAVLGEIERRVAQGHREIVLTGVNLGCFRDREAGYTLPRLVREAGALPGVERLRLSSIEVNHLTDDLVAALRETPAASRHLHVPLQSGDDAVLRAMRRRYSAEQYVAKLGPLGDFNLTADVIVGFPSEDEEAFRRTLEVVEQAGLSRLHVFPYSPRPGTERTVSIPCRLRSRRSAALVCARSPTSSRVVAGRRRSGAPIASSSIGRAVATATTTRRGSSPATSVSFCMLVPSVCRRRGSLPSPPENCLFCKLVAEGEHVHRADGFVAIRDINPIAETHLLVLPARHVDTFRDVDAFPDEEAASMLRFVADTAASCRPRRLQGARQRRRRGRADRLPSPLARPRRSLRHRQARTCARAGDGVVLIARIEDELKAARLARDEDRRDALSLLLNALQAAQKELQRPLSEDEELQVLQRERKRRVEAAEAFRSGGREEQAEDEEYELEVLAEFMPEQMSEEEIEEIIDDVISEVGATNIRDMGRVMAGVMHQVSGRADGSTVSQLVKEKLA